VIVNELAAETFTMKSAFVVPMLPSITDVSWIERVGNCACAADERKTPNASTRKDRRDGLIEFTRDNVTTGSSVETRTADDAQHDVS
jgi:hypothetical protein